MSVSRPSRSLTAASSFSIVGELEREDGTKETVRGYTSRILLKSGQVCSLVLQDETCLIPIHCYSSFGGGEECEPGMFFS